MQVVGIDVPQHREVWRDGPLAHEPRHGAAVSDVNGDGREEGDDLLDGRPRWRLERVSAEPVQVAEGEVGQ